MILRLAEDIYKQGFSIIDHAIPESLLAQLQHAASDSGIKNYKPAGIGRASEFHLEPNIRSDKIMWIAEHQTFGGAWLQWANDLRRQLNSKLMLGLFSFESHFALYGPGDFYKKHRDAFRGKSNRKLSLVLYLNADWARKDGGELILYDDSGVNELCRVLPNLGRIVLFLSEEFPHEVLPARRERRSIAGWFRVNDSQSRYLDPPA